MTSLRVFLRDIYSQHTVSTQGTEGILKRFAPQLM